MNASPTAPSFAEFRANRGVTLVDAPLEAADAPLTDASLEVRDPPRDLDAQADISDNLADVPMDPPADPVPALEVRAASFAYRAGAVPVISDLTSSFDSGRVTALTGPSGCGKSTLLYVLAGLLTPTSGEVLVDGNSFSTLPDGRRASLRASTMGFVFQDAMLDPARTVIDNVCEAAIFSGMGRWEARGRARHLLERFGVGHRFDHRPGEISGGQAQRVALCRALLTRPRLILADEPTGNLDPESADVVWEALRAAAREGACVIIATHSPSLADQADVRMVLTVPEESDMTSRDEEDES